MNPIISVEQLQELHRLGELFSKWSSNPFSMSERDLEELQGLSHNYGVDGTSALFAFQKQFQEEFNVTVQTSQSLPEAIEQALRPEAMARLDAALRAVPVTPMEQTAYIVPVEVRERRELTLEEIRQRERDQQREEEFNTLLKRAANSTTPSAELDLLIQAKEVGVLPIAAWNRLKFLQAQESAFERAEEAQEESAADREAQASYRADQLRDVLTVETLGDEREIEILRELSNVDELTSAESARLTELVDKPQPVQDSGSHKIPAGVLSEAISGNEKGNK